MSGSGLYTIAPQSPQPDTATQWDGYISYDGGLPPPVPTIFGTAYGLVSPTVTLSTGFTPIKISSINAHVGSLVGISITPPYSVVMPISTTVLIQFFGVISTPTLVSFSLFVNSVSNLIGAEGNGNNGTLARTSVIWEFSAGDIFQLNVYTPAVSYTINPTGNVEIGILIWDLGFSI